VFKPSGTLTGRSLDEMKENYEQQRDKEFKSHVRPYKEKMASSR